MNGPPASGPELTAAAVVERGGRFLIIEEMVQGRAVFNQPAGHVEPGESLCEAVVRETLEEAAWHFVPQFITGIYLWQDADTQRSFLRVALCGQLAGQAAHRNLDDGILRTLWLTGADLAERLTQLRSPLVLRCIVDYERGQRLDLDLDLDTGQTGLLLERAALL